jgi:biopolymer transport protein ExbD
MKFLPKKHAVEELNISPLIDMVFILLIFFAVSTTFVRDLQLTLDRPTAQSASSTSSETIRVYIDREGTVYVGEQPVNAWMVQSLVREELSIASSDTVLVIADRLTPTETLIDVVDQAKLAGAGEVGVATEQNAR